jgi:uncharacterized protein
MENFPAFTDYVLAILFGVVIPFASGIRSAKVFDQMQASFDAATKRRFYLGNSFFLFLIGFIIVAVWWLFDRPFTELGFTPPQLKQFYVPWWLTGLFILLYLMDVIASVRNKDEMQKTKEQMQDKTPFMPSKWKEMPAYIVMCIAAGVSEEIVYRGFMVNFFKYWMKDFSSVGTWAVIAPAVLFSFAHYYQGMKAVFKILVLSLLFGMIFWHSGSLYVVMALHFLVDLISGILSMKFSKKH